MKNVIMVLLVTFLSFAAQAQDKKNKNAKYEIEVSGNCEHCKKRIEKAAFGVSGVKSATWDVGTHKLSLILNEEKTSPNSRSSFSFLFTWVLPQKISTLSSGGILFCSSLLI